MMGHTTILVRPVHGLDIECAVAPGQDPHYELPTIVRRALKEQYLKNPKVVIGSGWKSLDTSTPKTGVTPVFTARCLSQIGGGPSTLEVDPRLQDPPSRVNWGLLTWVSMVGVVLLAAL